MSAPTVTLTLEQDIELASTVLITHAHALNRLWGAPSNVDAWSNDLHAGRDGRDFAETAFGDGETDGEESAA